MDKSQRGGRGFRRAVFFVAAITLLVTSMTDVASAKEIATCGASDGTGYYPAFGKWTDDKISDGKFTLTQTSEKEFDLLFVDARGSSFSAKQAGGAVILTGEANNAISIVVIHPSTTVTETYTFFRNADGNAQAIWTSNKGGGAPVMKVAAYRSNCSFFAY
jgi:hypothetical protein